MFDTPQFFSCCLHNSSLIAVNGACEHVDELNALSRELAKRTRPCMPLDFSSVAARTKAYYWEMKIVLWPSNAAFPIVSSAYAHVACLLTYSLCVKE